MKKDIANKKAEIARLIVSGLPMSHDLLKAMRQAEGKNTKSKTVKLASISTKAYKMLAEIEKSGLIANLTKTKKSVSYIIVNQHDCNFIRGEWLEFYISASPESTQRKNAEKWTKDRNIACVFGAELPMLDQKLREAVHDRRRI